MYKIFLVAFCLFFLIHLEARILETDKIAEILNEVDEKTLIFLDIDDTLLARKYMLGSTPWWTNCQNYFEEHQMRIDPFIFSLYESATQVPVRSVDIEATEIISSLQKKGNLVFGLTARRRKVNYAQDFDLITLNELKQLGIEFSKIKNINMPHYFEGILFTEGEKKGPILQEFLHNFKKEYTKIVFVDDSWSQVFSVESCMEKAGIPTLVYRFSGMDQTNNLFNPYIANIQLKAILEHQVLLTDEMAQKIGEELSENDPNFYLNFLFGSHSN